MPNEVTVANNADLVVASVLNRAVYELIQDRVDLRGTVRMVDSNTGRGSAAVKVPLTDFDETMAATAEAAAIANSALGDASATITAARQAVRYDVGDLFSLSGGAANLNAIVGGIAGAMVRRATGLITAAYTGFSNSVGTSGAALTVDNVYDAQEYMNLANANGPFFLVLHPKQYNDFVDSLRGEGGAAQFEAATAEQLAIKGQGFKGIWHGMEIFTSSKVSDDGTDYTGALYAMGALGMLEATPSDELASMIGGSNMWMQAAVPGSPLWVEIERDAAYGLTKIVGNYYAGLGELDDNLGVGIATGM